MGHNMAVWIGSGVALLAFVSQGLISWGAWKKTSEIQAEEIAELQRWRHETDRTVASALQQHEDSERRISRLERLHDGGRK